MCEFNFRKKQRENLRDQVEYLLCPLLYCTISNISFKILSLHLCLRVLTPWDNSTDWFESLKFTLIIVESQNWLRWKSFMKTKKTHPNMFVHPSFLDTASVICVSVRVYVCGCAFLNEYSFWFSCGWTIFFSVLLPLLLLLLLLSFTSFHIIIRYFSSINTCIYGKVH